MTPASTQPPAPTRRGPLFYVGAISLLTAMAVEAIAVVGRQIGVPFIGALELIQTAILLAASAAMLSATLSDAHASVSLLTDHLSLRARRWVNRCAALLSVLFFGALATGALWLAVDLWNAHEQSELLHVPLRPLRVISILAVAAIAIVFARGWWRPPPGAAQE
jgi:TRAP-type C4-dicarboxylate transport system permease small subunit